MTNEDLARAFEKYLARGDGYVMGANGELFTQELAEKWEDTRNKKKGYFTKDCARWIGRYVADCSGGIVAALREGGVISPGADYTANGFKAAFTASGVIASLPEIRGLALWHSGHIGIYIGGGYAIEFKGYKFGCVKTRVKGRGWTRWGCVNGVKYPEIPICYPLQMTVATKADPLNLRDEPKDGDIIAKIPKGAAVWALSEADGWCECVYYDGENYHGGYASKEYLK